MKKQSAAPERLVIVARHSSPEEPERQIVNGTMKSRTSGPRDITDERHAGGEYLNQCNVVEVRQSRVGVLEIVEALAVSHPGAFRLREIELHGSSVR